MTRYLVPLRRILGAALAVATGLTLVAQPASAATSDTLSLPPPTGPHQVGASSVYLKDTSRADPWVPSQPARELTHHRPGGRTAFHSSCCRLATPRSAAP